MALLPVWGWGPSLGPGHLDPLRAAEAVARVRPRVAVPVHWGTLALPGSTVVPPVRARMRRLLSEPPRTFADASTGSSMWLRTKSLRFPTDFIDTVWWKSSIACSDRTPSSRR